MLPQNSHLRGNCSFSHSSTVANRVFGTSMSLSIFRLLACVLFVAMTIASVNAM